MLTSTFATDYPWMQWTESLNSLASAQIRVDPSMLEATCVDGDSGEVDSNTGASSNDGSGNTCAYYSLSGNSGDCGSFDDGDFVAATLCCACGGGTTTNAHVNDASILAPYLGSPQTYALRWRHNSQGSYMGDDGAGNYYDYFSVTITYECDSDVLQLQTDIGDQTFNLDAASALSVLASSDTALTNSDRNTNCPYTMTCEQWDTSANSWTAISIPAYPRATCVDLTTNNDGNGNSCA